MITNVESVGATDIAEEALTGYDTPGLVPDVDEDVASAYDE